MTEPRSVDLTAVDDALEVLEVSVTPVHRKCVLGKSFLHREFSGFSR